MTLAQLLAFNVALLVAMFSPGPALLVAVQTNLSAGRPIRDGGGLRTRPDGRRPGR